MRQEFFTYSSGIIALAPAAIATVSIPIQADADFYWQKSTYFADIAAAGQVDSTRVIPLVTVGITDGASSRAISDAQIPIASLFGTGSLPFILPAPKTFAASGSIILALTNFDAAITYNIRLFFHGHKLFR